jgi:hypothetical protein
MLWFAQGSASLFLMVAELRAQERQAAEELGQWKTRVGERKVIDASPPGNQTGLCAMVSLPKYSPPMPRPPSGGCGWMA